MKKYQGIGIMTGTSMDGIDLACCDFFEESGKWRFEMVQSESVPMDPQWKARLQNLFGQSAEIYAKTDVYFAHYLGKSVQAFIEQHDLRPDFVASHGQTIFHQPDKNYTGQIGDGETMVSYLECPLVTNFRNKNVAKGGEGAPLVPFGEMHLWPDQQLFLNLGGIANMTWQQQAFDISPCNLVLNHLIADYMPGAEYDEGGKTAASGKVHPALFQALNALPYYHRKPPKSLGVEWINEHYFPTLSQFEVSHPDALATSTVHIAHQIGLAIQRLNIRDQQLLITGGGRHNSFLMQQIASQIEANHIQIVEADNAIVDFKEAIIFAFLGLFTLLGKPNTLAKATGTPDAVLGGSIHLPAKGFRPLLD
jgi:anhydro-N-acetylmuramic acid kinase